MASWRYRLICTWATVLSLAILIVNDGWWKAAYPGWITGKLSDFAGVFLVAMLLIAFTARPKIALASTLVGFAVLKTVPAASGWMEPVFGGTTVTDPSDLIAVTMLPAAWFAMYRTRDKSPSTITWRDRCVAALILATAALGTSATSCDPQSEVTGLSVTSSGRVLAQVDSGDWFDVTDREITEVSPVASLARAAGSESCVGERCFRVVPGTAVFEGEVPIVAFDTDDSRKYGEASPCFQVEPFTSVVARPTDSGVEVWVSMGMSGVVHIGADGTVDDRRPRRLKAAYLDITETGVSISDSRGKDPTRFIAVALLVAIGLALAVPIVMVVVRTIRRSTRRTR